jgi:hypothetical protein
LSRHAFEPSLPKEARKQRRVSAPDSRAALQRADVRYGPYSPRLRKVIPIAAIAPLAYPAETVAPVGHHLSAATQASELLALEILPASALRFLFHEQESKGNHCLSLHKGLAP